MTQPFNIIIKYSKKLYFKAIGSIAFYPVLIGFAFFALALGVLYAEELELINKLKEKAPYFFVQDYETARTILSTLIGGILSLTVFSFAMVMLVLNQASANLSPRLLPGLISDKKHQIILGIYIGTLLYYIIVLLSLGAYGVDSNSMGLSTTLASVFGVMCVSLFVYFIHTISGAIQIHNIIERIYMATDNSLKAHLSSQSDSTINLKSIDSKDWHTIATQQTGFFMGLDVSLLNDSLLEMSNQILLLPYLGEHLWEGDPLLRVKNTINVQDEENLLFCINISANRQDIDDSIGGMIQLMEIAVKAMSPGINDPGTAISVISNLGKLLSKILQNPKWTSGLMKKGKVTLIKKSIGGKELMQSIIQPIRNYSKSDVFVLQALIAALQYMASCPNISRKNNKAVKKEIQAIYHEVGQMENALDRSYLSNTLVK